MGWNKSVSLWGAFSTPWTAYSILAPIRQQCPRPLSKVLDLELEIRLPARWLLRAIKQLLLTHWVLPLSVSSSVEPLPLHLIKRDSVGHLKIFSRLSTVVVYQTLSFYLDIFLIIKRNPIHNETPVLCRWMNINISELAISPSLPNFPSFSKTLYRVLPTWPLNW